MTREEAINILNEWSGHGPLSGGVCSVFFSATLDEVEEALNMAIAALGEQPRWISVSDHLPNDTEKVLVYTTTGNTTVARWSQRQEKFVASGHITVTHWMALPEKPEEGA